jgi:hypothetical protein
MISKHIKEVKSGMIGYDYTVGLFCLYDDTTHTIFELHTCRDGFAKYFKKENKFIGFNCIKWNLKQFNEFWIQIENKLNLKTKTWFYRTQIKVSPFWLENDTRRSLFTLLLRCGACFYKGNLDDALKNYDLSSLVIPAIRHFLDGNTVPTYDSIHKIDNYVAYFIGFVKTFCNKTQDQLNELLIKT